MKRRSLAACLLLISIYAVPASADEWRFHLAPYLWAAGLNGNTQVGPVNSEVDASFGDLVSLLDIGGMVHFEANNPQWGLFADAMYIKLSDEKNLPRGTLSGEAKTSIFEGGVSYRFTPTVEGLLGLRYQKYKLGLTLPGPAGAFSRSQDWTDGFVGVRWMPVQTDKWTVWLRGDVGGGDSDLVWLAAIGAGYRINKTVSLAGGFRYLDTDVSKDGFTWDVAMSGLFFGADFSW